MSMNADRAPLPDAGEKHTTTDDAEWMEGVQPLTEEDPEGETVRDLGFIVDDHDDRRVTLTDGWNPLPGPDNQESLETNRQGVAAHDVGLRERGASPDRFATDYHQQNAQAEAQEEDFIGSSLGSDDPDPNEPEDYASRTFHHSHGEPLATDIVGEVIGAAPGLGATVAQDIGADGFQIEEEPLVEPSRMPSPQDAVREAMTDYDDERTVR